ncbi:MAG TPA: GNAT family N-acetyltransferase [Bacillales bacterium]|nr:GNAT family N-acetyltransferase [Bacillales bacterium]
MISIIEASTDNDFNQARELFIEYSKSLGISLEFQNFDEELKNIPGMYGVLGGCLLLALDNEQTIGCVALRKIDDNICEMKRLYVLPDWNLQGIGKMLAKSIIEEAKIRGYRFMRLDTLPAMKRAISLYHSLGFYRIEPYRFNPIEGALYLELDLTSFSGSLPLP